MHTFQALMVSKTDQDFSVKMKTLTKEDLPRSDVFIKVAYSSVNYKDGLASTPNGKIIQKYPLIPGIDLTGIVESSDDPRFQKGDKVIATSYDIGVAHHGGYSEYACIPADWVVKLPEELTLREAAILGTAGLTAALSISKLEEHGVQPDHGEILVTGATGGVGSLAVDMLTNKGYRVTASTGKAEQHDYLKKLGAESVIPREEVYNGSLKPLKQQRWAGVIDPVGGSVLASVLSQLQYGGVAAVSGLTAGTDLPATVFPFILRGVSLVGIDSVFCPMNIREPMWRRMATDLKPAHLEEIVAQEVRLEQLPEQLSTILDGHITGRILVAVGETEIK
ncbi:acrylyl-CoA reductase family protein [Gracilibacillus alcaliphilus]|uniref:acrylyl-CoA reductase family protein n=1 Tax=Gracilibacillus alcaliphilus TaxID=1401441 RepID=UPI0019575A34|nr:acryloyl-CoA reductase [Gracilibacillus alcaliphilus]MBM7676316.1 putative YhdH/YhfP family quinone oxidoreductase [Gracilibacillus alcaliphilus]